MKAISSSPHHITWLRFIAKLGVVTFVAGVIAGQHELIIFGLLALVFHLVSHYLIIMERRSQNGWIVLLIAMAWGVLLTMTLAWLLRSVQQVFAH
jgi:hypothetical protein